MSLSALSPSLPPAHSTSQPLLPLLIQSKKALFLSESLCNDTERAVHSAKETLRGLGGVMSAERWVKGAVEKAVEEARGTVAEVRERESDLSKEVKQWKVACIARLSSMDARLLELESTHPPAVPSAHDSLDPFQAPADDPGSLRQHTLRDFIDEPALEVLFQTLCTARGELEEALRASSSLSRSLGHRLTQLTPPSKNALEREREAKELERWLDHYQREKAEKMAEELESVGRHYEQVLTAQNEEVTEEDLELLEQDTEELPSVLAEMEEVLAEARSMNDRSTALRQRHNDALEAARSRQAQAEQLFETLSASLALQTDIEAFAQSRISILSSTFESLATLEEYFGSYLTAHTELGRELQRRKRHEDEFEELRREFERAIEQRRLEEADLRKGWEEKWGEWLPRDLMEMYVSGSS